MPPVPLVRGDQLVKALGKAGFTVVRIRGSHHVVRHEDGRSTAIPVHGGREIPRGTLRGILVYLHLTVDELNDLL